MQQALANHVRRCYEVRHAMPFLLLTVALQVTAVVHLFRTGRNMTWLFLIILVPMVGCIAYFIIEVLPSLSQSPAARKALRRAQQAIDPNRALREGSLNYERSQNIESAARLAGELTKAGRHAEAIRICTEARTGLFEDDPKSSRAWLTRNSRRTTTTPRSLRSIICATRTRGSAPPTAISSTRERSKRAALRSARSRSIRRWRTTIRGPKRACARRSSTRSSAKRSAPQSCSRLVLKDARLAPKHFQRSEREWIELAKREST